jgi:predicted dehydrogenase
MTARLTRRQFLRASAAATAAGAAAPYFMPAAAWSRVAGSNERITLGVVGTGGMGTAHLRDLMARRERDNVAVSRVCDVYRRRLNNAIRLIDGAECCGTMEYREVLDDPSVDAVLIATPDHWHTKIAIEAMDAGKDVYVEKPLSLTIEQALACRDAVKRTGRTLQVGPQGTSDGKYWAARGAIAAGKAGKITWSRAAYCRNSRNGQFNWAIDADAGPNQPPTAEGYVWWDRWLGSRWGLAEAIPWNPDHFFRFRKYFAYNGGVATDLMYHRLAPLLLAIRGPDGEYPLRAVAAGGRYIEKDERDIPDTFMLMIDYPSEHTVVLASVMTNDVGIDERIHGQHATLEFGGPDLVLREQAEWADEFRRANGIETRTVRDEQGRERREPARGAALATIPPVPRPDHMGAFLGAIRGTCSVACNVELGCSTMVAIRMGVDAYRQGRVVRWDARRERAV